MPNKYNVCLLLGFACASTSIYALEIAPGDYEPIPAGMTALLTYYQHAERKDFYSEGHKVSDNSKLRSDVALLRLIHSVGLSESLVVQPQFILPYGQLKAGGDIDTLGQVTGIGDLILGAPFIWTLPTEHKDVVSIAPFIYLPTGDYNHDRGLNLGDNRWKFVLQGVYNHHFSETWALDAAADVTWATNNDEYGPDEIRSEQKARYEYQTHVRYNVNNTMSVAVGAGHIRGAENSLEGASQNDELRTTYARLTFTYFVEPTMQLQAQLGKDLEVDQGSKESSRINLRFTKLF